MSGIESSKTRFAVRQSTDGFLLDEVVSGRFREASITFDEPPRASFVIPDPSGVLSASVLRNGKEFEIRRGINGTQGELRFQGIIEDVDGSEDPDGVQVVVRGVHKGYKMLQQHICDSYDFDEDGNPGTVRDGVTIDPWDFFIFRQAGGPLDVRGEPLPIDGVTFDDAVRCIVTGTRFIHQIDFLDNSRFLASGIYATTNKVQVYRDGPTGDLRPVLQRIRNGTTFAAGGSVETVPLENGSPDIDPMGDISAVTVILIGEAINGNPTVQVCRNARDGTRQYTAGKSAASTNILYDNNITDTGLDKWTLTFSGADWPGVGSLNSLGVKITLPGSAGEATTTKVHYMKVVCTTASDTGLSEGTIEAYSNPVPLRDDIDPSAWVESAFTEKNRLEAGEMLRQLTESDSAVNPNPHWDLWIDGDLAVHFKERRGTDKTRVYSFPEGNLRKVSHEFVGTELAYQTIAYGSGSGPAQTRIVSKEEFSAGGLYDSDRDPADGALYGELACVRPFVDANEVSPVALYRKARAIHKLRRDPIENIRVDIEAEFIRYFETGDRIQIKNIRTRTNASLRVVDLERAWDQSENEKLSVTLGNPLDDLPRAMATQGSKHDTLVVRAKPAPATTGISGDGVHCDKDHYGVFAFGIPEGPAVDRVMLKLTTVPWQINARGAASGGGSTSGAGGGTTQTSDSFGFVDTTRRARVGTDAGASVPGGTTKQRVILGDSISGSAYVEMWVDVITNSPSGAAYNSFPFSDVTETHDHDVTLPNHTHTTPNHIHPPEFGIWQFDGDSGDGTGSPLYGSGIELAVDPTVNAAGVPTSFATEKHPQVWGNRTAPQSIEIDVTGYLEVDANGIIKSGEHKVYLKAAAAVDNAKGLAVISITPILRLRTQA